MDLYLNKLFSAVILPPVGLAILLTVALMLWRAFPALSKKLVLMTCVLLILLSLPLVSGSLMSLLENTEPLTLDTVKQRQPQAIVVLAGGRDDAPEYGGVSVNQFSLFRLRYAAKLARQFQLDILVSGGNEEIDRPAEAKLMAKVLSDEFGTQPRWLELQSRNTAENAIYSAEILQKEDIHTVLLVTHAWHMPRAQLAFANTGIQVIPAPTGFAGLINSPALSDLLPSISAFADSYYALHEIVGLVWYRLRY